MDPSILEREARSGDQIPDRARNQHFAGVGEGRHASGDVDGDPSHVGSDELDLTRVASGPDRETEITHGAADRTSAPDSAGGSIERRQEPVTGRVDPSAPIEVDLARARSLCSASTRFHAASPSRAASSVEPTISVNNSVAKTRSASVDRRMPVKNSSISPARLSAPSP